MHEKPKNHPNLLVLLFALSVSCIALLAMPPWRESSSDTTRQLERLAPGVGSAHQPRPTGMPTHRNVATIKADTVASGRALSTLASLTPSGLPTPAEVSAEFGAWLERANAGDPLAARAIHLLLNVCRPIGGGPRRIAPSEPSPGSTASAPINESCSKITEDMVQDRTRWLEIAARNGDVSAMVEYALHARELGLFEVGWAWSNPQRAIAVQSQAIAFLEDSAAHGVVESYLELARSLEFGHFGRKDAIGSLAYALALDQLQPGSLPSESLAIRMQKLTPAERASALQQATSLSSACCKKANR